MNNNVNISLTIDTWTTIQIFNYMVLTAYFVNDDCILGKMILNFCQISNHKGKNHWEVNKFLFNNILYKWVRHVTHITCFR